MNDTLIAGIQQFTTETRHNLERKNQPATGIKNYPNKP